MPRASPGVFICTRGDTVTVYRLTGAARPRGGKNAVERTPAGRRGIERRTPPTSFKGGRMFYYYFFFFPANTRVRPRRHTVDLTRSPGVRFRRSPSQPAAAAATAGPLGRPFGRDSVQLRDGFPVKRRAARYAAAAGVIQLYESSANNIAVTSM